MKLRLFREYFWAIANQNVFGEPQYQLSSFDRIQYQDEDGEWRNLPVVEGERPKHPKRLS